MIRAALPALLLVATLWLIKVFELRTSQNLYQFGIFPRTLEGLPGIFTHVLIHGDMQHLAANSFPLLVLGWMAYYFYPNIFSRIAVSGWLLTGLMVWIMGRSTWHIGASGLVYALATFVLVSSILRKTPRQLAITFFIIFMYGGMIWGVLPIQEGVSWEAHLCGAVVGVAAAILYRDIDLPPKAFEDEDMENPFKYRYRPEKPANDL